jgi:glycosyltransferase involved in cell wall biosynthesis
MTDKDPAVSIIIPCYNLGEYLNDAVASVKAQTFTDWEVIIVNDGSTDETTIDIINKIDHEEPAFEILNQRNMGLSAARNNGIKKANGAYIVCLDADDMLMPDYLQKTVTVLENDTTKKIAVATTWLQEFGLRDNIWKPTDFSIPNLLVTNVLHAGSLFKKSAWQEAGGYKENMNKGYEDWEYWLSIAECGYRWVTVPEPLFKYRIRENSMLAGSKQMHMEIYGKLYDLHE